MYPCTVRCGGMRLSVLGSPRWVRSLSRAGVSMPRATGRPVGWGLRRWPLAALPRGRPRGRLGGAAWRYLWRPRLLRPWCWPATAVPRRVWRPTSPTMGGSPPWTLRLVMLPYTDLSLLCRRLLRRLALRLSIMGTSQKKVGGLGLSGLGNMPLMRMMTTMSGVIGVVIILPARSSTVPARSE